MDTKKENGLITLTEGRLAEILKESHLCGVLCHIFNDKGDPKINLEDAKTSASRIIEALKKEG
jgi:hypothetical protein